MTSEGLLCHAHLYFVARSFTGVLLTAAFTSSASVVLSRSRTSTSKIGVCDQAEIFWSCESAVSRCVLIVYAIDILEIWCQEETKHLTRNFFKLAHRIQPVAVMEKVGSRLLEQESGVQDVMLYLTVSVLRSWNPFRMADSPGVVALAHQNEFHAELSKVQVSIKDNSKMD